MADLITEACVHLSVFASSATSLKPLLTSYCHTRLLTVAAAPGKDWTTASTSEGGLLLPSKDRTVAADGRDSPCWYHRPEPVRPAVLAGHRGGGITWQRPAPYCAQSNNSSISSTRSAPRSSGGFVADYHRLQQGGGWRRDSLTETLRIGWAGGGRRERQPSTASDDSGPIIIQNMSEVRLHDVEDGMSVRYGEDAASLHYMAEGEGGMF